MSDASALSESPLGAAAPDLPATTSSDAPVFVVGLSRSGSTLLSRMLDAHSALAIFPETWWYVALDRFGCLEEFTDPWQYILFLNQVWDSLKSERDPAARVLAMEGVKQPQYVGPTRPVLEKLGRAYASVRKARVWGEKTPGHVLWLPQIRALFPNARVVATVRDPRDVLVSYDERWNHGRGDTDFLMKSAAQVKHYLAHLLYQSVFPPEQVCRVKYESLVSQPSVVLEEVCRFLQLDFEPGMLEFYRQQEKAERSTSDAKHHELLSKPATTERINRYVQKFRPAQCALIERFLHEEMNVLGYGASLHEPGKWSTGDEKAYEEGVRTYEQMRSGALREEHRRAGQRKLAVYRWFGKALAWTTRKVALTSRDWQARAETAGRELG